MIFYVGANDISHGIIIYFTQKVLRSAESFLIIGASLSEPHHRRSTVKSVFLLACLLDTSSLIRLSASLIWLSASQNYIKLEWCVNRY